MSSIVVDVPPLLPEVPEHVTYILVGAGTASLAAYRAIRKADKSAKVQYLNFAILHVQYGHASARKLHCTCGEE